MIYCIVPPELGDAAFRRLVEHYKDNPNVKVIVERRKDRSGGVARATRDRRQRAPGASEI